MNFKRNTIRGYVAVVCFGIAGVVVIGGVAIYIMIKACKRIPPPTPPDPGTNELYIAIVDAPHIGQGFVQAGLIAYDGSKTFVLKVTTHDDLLGHGEKVYWLTGVLQSATSAEVRAYDSQGVCIGTNQFYGAP